MPAVVGLALAGGAASGWALGIRVSNQDGLATARGNAFVATADNASAVYYNPAGITQGSGWEARVGMYTILLESEYAGPGGAVEDTQDRPFFVPQMYATWAPEDCPWAIGLGVYSPYGLGSLWATDVPFRAVGYRAELAYATVNPVLAWDLGGGLSLAGGPTVNYGDFQSETGIGTVAADRLRFRGRGAGLGFNAGIRWQLDEQHAFGVSYRSADRLTFDGHASTVITGVAATRETARMGFRFPQTVSVGYSFRPTPAWNVEVNADWTGWERLDAALLEKGSGNLTLPLFWESGWIYKAGVTRELAHGYHASAGYWFAEETVPDAVFTTLVNDQALHVFSLGVGRRGERWDWDATFQYGHGPARDVAGSLPAQGQTADGRYELRTLAFLVSVGRRF